MSYSFVDHTGDAGLEVVADDLAELFTDALRGMSDTITDVETMEDSLERPFAVEAPELDLLLRDFLDEALARFEIQRELFRDARLEIVRDGSAWALTGSATGETFDPVRHPAKVAIKAVTYHQLEVTRCGRRWRGRVIFDI